MAGPSKKARIIDSFLNELYWDSGSEENVCEDDSSDADLSDKEFVELDLCENNTIDSAPIIYGFSGYPRGIARNLIPLINDESSPLDIFKLFYTDIFDIVLDETNRYYHQFTSGNNKQNEDITMSDIYKFLAIILQMGHDQRETMKDYWSRKEQYYIPFFSKIMPRDKFFHIMKYLHFSNNENPPSQDDANFDRLWKLRKIFDILNNKFAELYSPSEHLALGEITVLFKGQIILKQFIPKRQLNSGVKLFKLCDSEGYTYAMNEYISKQGPQESELIPYETVLQLVSKISGMGYKLFLDSYFASPKLFEDLHHFQINACGNVRWSRKGMPLNFRPKILRMKTGDLIARKLKNNINAICWKGKREVYMITSMHHCPSEGNFIDGSGNSVTPQIVNDYKIHMSYIDKNNRMANNYGVARKTWKWTKKLFFHLTDITIVNAFIIHKSCGGKLTHKLFREQLVRDLLSSVIHESTPTTKVGRPGRATEHLTRLEARHSEHWPDKKNIRRCRVCSSQNKISKTMYCCKKCDVGLCVKGCFEKWHTQVQF